MSEKTITTKSPAMERDGAQIVLCKSVVEQLTALNRTIACANKLGINIQLFLTGSNNTPEIRDIYVLRGNKAKRIYSEVFNDHG